MIGPMAGRTGASNGGLMMAVDWKLVRGISDSMVRGVGDCVLRGVGDCVATPLTTQSLRC